MQGRVLTRHPRMLSAGSKRLQARAQLTVKRFMGFWRDRLMGLLSFGDAILKHAVQSAKVKSSPCLPSRTTRHTGIGGMLRCCCKASNGPRCHTLMSTSCCKDSGRYTSCSSPLRCERLGLSGTAGAQVLFWASLHLLRRMKWAVLGRPQPPIVHASPTVAALQACATAEEAAELSLQKGYSAGGTAPLP